MLGVVWPDRHVAFPDFFDPTNATLKWWIDEFVRFQQQVIRGFVLCRLEQKRRIQIKTQQLDLRKEYVKGE